MKTSTTIFLENLVFYAYHGVLPQERTVGNTFIINLSVKGDFLKAIETDQIEDSISYADIYEVVKQEMNIPSKLLEHACGRIVKALFREFPSIEEIRLKLSKNNPPMGADIDSAGIEMLSLRE
ncbi:dihydroneopterin aldolase [uncultured Bacteroides sp.]|uniref:dihydroneopterin aldolase n=1 Tax=uncultured Bacteroides sp. TaxID=162156 RepID=UPI002AABF165|nr:dihydroneopterin aldolase [uncultured Bacteroides sp.]